MSRTMTTETRPAPPLRPSDSAQPRITGQIVLLFLGLTCGHLAWSQSTIAYCGGPAFQIPTEFYPASLDFDRNGTADVAFIGGVPICTMDVPCSLCSMSFYAASPGTNALLVATNHVALLSAGEWISSTPAPGSAWSSGDTATLITFWWSERYGTSGTAGPLATASEGYLGARFYGPAGLHYGWVHVRWTTVLDWAYETRPGTGIKAGAKPVPVPLAPPGVARPGYLRLRWASEIGRAYQVQAKDRLDAFPWTNLNFVVPATATNSMLDVEMSGAAQFFRVVEAD